MRKIIVSIHSTFNGVVTGAADDDPTNFMAWAQAGIKDTGSDFIENFDNVDTIMLGRATYEDLVRKWPHAKEWPGVTEKDLQLAEKVNTTPKVIVTGEHPLENPQWGEFEAPTQMTGSNIEEQIKTMKEQDGGDILTFGSPTLVQSLTNADLVDEYRVIVHPVIVGDDGHKRLFENINGRKDLKLIRTKTYEHGAVLMCYAPVKL